MHTEFAEILRTFAQSVRVERRHQPFHVAPRAEHAPPRAAIVDEELAVRAAEVHVDAAVPVHPYVNSPRFVNKFAEIRE